MYNQTEEFILFNIEKEEEIIAENNCIIQLIKILDDLMKPSNISEFISHLKPKQFIPLPLEVESGNY
jgi:hypothetical protein